MTDEDLFEVVEVELESFSTPWSTESFMDEMDREFSYVYLARDEEANLLGFVCFWVLTEEMHILNIAVRNKYRRMGIGRALAVHALGLAREMGARSATLEVREKNTAAVGLYESLGFVRAGLRRNYYEQPRDNAVIMWLYDINSALQKSP